MSNRIKGKKTQDHGHLHWRDAMAGKAVEGGIYWCVQCLYQPSPNIHTKYVLLSKCTG